MADNFPYVIPRILKDEGGLVNNPADPGGLTKYGISKKAYPTLDIVNLTPEAASDIYKRDYWLKNSLDKIVDKDNAHIAMDTVVNHGSGEGGKLIQRALNNVGASLTVDGSIGPNTIAAINKSDPKKFQQALHDMRASFYATLSNSGTFLKGWLSRISKWNTGATVGAGGVGLAILALGLVTIWYLRRGEK